MVVICWQWAYYKKPQGDITFNMETKRAVLVGLSITGTIVGVGFASGREIVSFFAGHGLLSVLFCFVAGGLFFLLSYLIFYISAASRKVGDLGKASAKIFDAVLFVCQVVIASAMIAGLESLFAGFGFSGSACFCLRLFACAVAFCLLAVRQNGAYVANSILSAAMFGFVLVIFVMMLFRGARLEENKLFDSGLLFLPVLYVGMNVFTAFPLMREMGEFMKSKKEMLLSGLFVGLFVTFCLLVINIIIFLVPAGIKNSGMVMVDAAYYVSPLLGKAYVVLLAFCILTTLVSTLYGAATSLGKKLPFKKRLAASTLIAFAVSFVGFSKIIDIVYPFIGLVCIILVFAKVLFFWRKMLKNENTKHWERVKKNAKCGDKTLKKCFKMPN